MNLLHTLVTYTLAMCAFTCAQAQSYPTRPIRFIMPFPPGGGNDVMARIIGQKLSDALGQQVIVDNRGGAGGNFGAEIAARAAPDGYTLLLGGVGSHGTNPGLQATLPYDPIRDYTPVTQISSASLVVTANLALPAKSIAELIKLAQAQPGRLNASAGTGTIAHLSVELFNAMAKVKLRHVPYKGTGPALSDLFSGQVQLLFKTPSSAKCQVYTFHRQEVECEDLSLQNSVTVWRRGNRWNGARARCVRCASMRRMDCWRGRQIRSGIVTEHTEYPESAGWR